jgi:hypothetical protein
MKIDNPNNNNNEVIHTSHAYKQTEDNPVICLTRGMVFCNLLNKVFVELDEDIELLHILEREFSLIESKGKPKRKDNDGLMNALRCFYFDDDGIRSKELYPYTNYLETMGVYDCQLHGEPCPTYGDIPIKPFSYEIALMLLQIGGAFTEGNPITKEWSFLRDGELKNHKFVEGEDIDSLKPIDWKDVDAGERNWSLFPRLVLRMQRFLDLYKGDIDDNELFRDVYDIRTVWSWNESWMSDQQYSEHQTYALFRSHGEEPSKEGFEYWEDQFEKYYDADAGLCTDCWLQKHYPELLPDEDSLYKLMSLANDEDWVEGNSVIASLNAYCCPVFESEQFSKNSCVTLHGQILVY